MKKNVVFRSVKVTFKTILKCIFQTRTSVTPKNINNEILDENKKGVNLYK